MGQKLTHKGAEPYLVKEAAIRKMLVPTDKASVHRFLEVCHCLSIFFDNLSESVLPLRNLAKDDSAFLWSESHETAFKSIVTSTTALRYYDPHLPVTLQGMTTVSADLFQLMAAITSSWLTITVTL